MKLGRARGLSNGHLFPKFCEFWSGGSAIPCGNMHQSFTDALVCYGFTAWIVDFSSELARLFIGIEGRHVHSQT